MRSCYRDLVLFLVGMCLAVGGGVLPTHAAEDFPAKPVTLVIPVGAGGSHDLTARAMVSVIPQYLGQPILIQLRPGGGGAIGSQQVANAEPDGYTLLFGGPGWSTALPAIEGRSAGPDQLAAVARVNYSPVLFIARPAAPFKSLKEMVEWARAHPGMLIHGHTGPWGAGDLPMKQMMKEFGFQAQIVPHNGGGPALLAILGGHIQTTISLTAQSLPHIQAGKLQVLAVLDTQRHPELPDVPTGIEQGINVTYNIWRAVLAPKATPRPVIDKLAAAIKHTTEDKSFQSLIKKLGDQPAFAGPEEFTREWLKEYEVHKEIARTFKQ